MTQKERLYFGGVTKETRMCANCAHYIDHFMKSNGEFYLLAFGHCTYPRIKNRSAYDECKYFELKQERSAEK